MEDKTCLFCSELETVTHLFFDCCVAKILWGYLVEIFHHPLGIDFESAARWWVSNAKHKIMNGCSATLMWSLWRFRNEMCFHGKIWMGEKDLVRKLLNILRNWRSLYTDEDAMKLDQVMGDLANKLEAPLGLPTPAQRRLQRSSSQEESASVLEVSAGRTSSSTAMPLKVSDRVRSYGSGNIYIRLDPITWYLIPNGWSKT